MFAYLPDRPANRLECAEAPDRPRHRLRLSILVHASLRLGHRLRLPHPGLREARTHPLGVGSRRKPVKLLDVHVRRRRQPQRHHDYGQLIVQLWHDFTMGLAPGKTVLGREGH
jgi:hypothetical protein